MIEYTNRIVTIITGYKMRSICQFVWGLVFVKRENGARVLHQLHVNLRDREAKWSPTSICSQAFAQEAQRKHQLDLKSPIVDHNYNYQQQNCLT